MYAPIQIRYSRTIFGVFCYCRLVNVVGGGSWWWGLVDGKDGRNPAADYLALGAHATFKLFIARALLLHFGT